MVHVTKCKVYLSNYNISDVTCIIDGDTATLSGDTATLSEVRRSFGYTYSTIHKKRSFPMRFKGFLLVGAAVLAVILGMWGRISYLEGSREKVIVELEQSRSALIVAHSVNANNVANAGMLLAKLNSCVAINKLNKDNAVLAVEGYNKSLREIRDNVAKESQRVKEVLQNETCAMVNLPSDVESVLRNRAKKLYVHSKLESY